MALLLAGAAALGAVGVAIHPAAFSASDFRIADSPPPAPTGVGAVGVSTSAVYLNWTNPSVIGLTDNEVTIYSDAGCSSPLGAIDLGTVAVGFEWGDLSSSTTYGFTVQAATSGGLGAASACASARTGTPAPAAPTGLVASPASDTAIVLDWTNPSDGALTDNEVSIYSDAECLSPLGAIDLGAVSTGFEWGSLSADTTYGFTVQAATSGGLGPASGCAAATTDSPAPGTPTALTATAASDSAIYLTWTNPSESGLTDSEVTIYSDAGCSSPLGAIDIGVVSSGFEWGSLSPDTTYGFTVQAATSGGLGPASGCASATTGAAPPSAPVSLTTSAASSSAIYMGWSGPASDGGSPVTYYEVTIYTGSSCSDPLGAINVSGSSTFQFEWGGLSASTTYDFTVQAANDVGLGPDSGCASATTDDPVPGTPTGLTATAASDSAVDLTWTNPSDSGLIDDQVFIYSDAGCVTPLGVIDIGEVTTSFEWGGLNSGTTYGFTVQAATDGGYGPQSSCVSATTT